MTRPRDTPSLRTASATARSRSPPAASRSAWSASPMPRCRSIACSARSPASAAPRSAPTSRPSRLVERSHDHRPLRRQYRGEPALDLRARAASSCDVKLGEQNLAFYRATNRSRDDTSPARAVFNVTPAERRRLFQQDPVLLLHRADAQAGRERRYAGRRSSSIRRSSRTPISKADHHHAVLHVLSGRASPNLSSAEPSTETNLN